MSLSSNHTLPFPSLLIPWTGSLLKEITPLKTQPEVKESQGRIRNGQKEMAQQLRMSAFGKGSFFKQHSVSTDSN